jgi:hypothetical protein
LTTYFVTPEPPSVACALAQPSVIVPVPPVTVRLPLVPSTGAVTSVQLAVPLPV